MAKSKKAAVPPKLWRPKVVKLKTPKALVVGADYFALTTRIDSQVQFWTANQAHNSSELPKDITILWVAGDLLAEVRGRLLSQAVAGNLEVWNCELFELREKLLPIWGDESNRSLVEVVLPGMSAVSDTPAEDDDEAKAERAVALRQAIERYQVLHPEGPSRPKRGKNKAVLSKEALKLPSPAAPTPTPVSVLSLDKLPAFDRKVYESYLHHAGKNGDRLAIVAAQVKIPAANVKALVERVERKLGITKTD